MVQSAAQSAAAQRLQENASSKRLFFDLFGTPTRFGNMAAQMRNFLDQTGGLWANGALVGKVGSVFICTAPQHAVMSTLVRFHFTLLLQGRHVAQIINALIAGRKVAG
jgi:hypothetical protein